MPFTDEASLARRQRLAAAIAQRPMIEQPVMQGPAAPALPGAPAPDPESIRRRMMLAQALMQNGQQGMQPTMVNGKIGKQSTLGTIASAMSQIGGGYLQGKASNEEATFKQQQQKQLQDALGTMTGGDPSTGPVDPKRTAALGVLKNLPPDALQNLVGQQAAASLFPKAKKVEKVDFGDAIGFVDSETGQEVGKRAPKGASPDATLSATTSRENAQLGAKTSSENTDKTVGATLQGQKVTERGQNITANTALEGQKTAREIAATKAAGNVNAKLPVLDSLDYVADQFRAGLKNVSTGGPMGLKGKISGVTDYQDAKVLDNLSQQLSTELRTLFRIPGEGSLSDKEQAQYGLQLPSRDYDADKNEKIIRDIQNRARLRLSQPLLPPPGSLTPSAAPAADLSGMSNEDLMKALTSG